jgi:3-phenylpropionate/trans-cinnamate dioxygenase ferredoxin subunit
MNSSKQYRWHKVAESFAELSIGNASTHQVKVAGREICLARSGENWHACAAKCPHAGGRMADGWVDALGNIVCPLHRYRFNLKNGTNTSGEGYFMKTYPVQETDDGVFVGIEAI